ncbi:hypothetical protein CQA66_05100 [Helicobacter aurati]|uniref:PLD phosphodiesterase domain-containing protein n=1 Tax=Helicobacter aurati TaxID=137778 RepID=A0A3D8J5H4_9HELI|nr:phospholipase D-like domain-containing protein [Helicobacter aurati]RDU72436.1 hypothetical protein CQA66_05100 [Helicobacter aurati]
MDYYAIESKSIHQIELKILDMIEILSSTKYDNLHEKLKALTQLDEEVFDSIISDLHLKGYITSLPLALSAKGKEVKNKPEEIKSADSKKLCIDSIMGEIESFENDDKKTKYKKPQDLPKDAIELKPKLSFSPSTQTLNEEFADNKTLRTCLIEALENIESRDSNADKEAQKTQRKVWDIEEVVPNRNSKIFQKLICLFYQYKDEKDKILIVDSDYEKNEALTQRVEKILETDKLEPLTNPKNSSNKWEEHTEEKSKSKERLSFEEGQNILVYDFPRYLIYALQNAIRTIHISSPWIKIKALKRYEEHIENALKRGVEVSIKYGFANDKKKNKKSDIDVESQEIFDRFAEKYPHFKPINGHSHAKVLIFDNEWVIKGSFNWFSFGVDEHDKNTAKEEGLLTKNKETIKKARKS